jgi:hypothetical protein
MAFENFTIEQFMKALFEGDRSESGIPEKLFEVVFNEYADYAGIYSSEEFEKSAYLHFLLNRVNSIAIAIKLQADFLSEFGFPCEEKLKFFLRFGHRIVWTGDKDKFVNDLIAIKSSESRYVSKLNMTYKELEDIKSKKGSEDISKKEQRKSFIRLINTLSKNGYTIDKKKTSVEEFAIMINQELEYSKEKLSK